MADDSVYECLDFVDATDRYRSLWVWRLLGTSVGVCDALRPWWGRWTASGDQWPAGVVHFYGYSLVSALALLVSIAFPVRLRQAFWDGQSPVLVVGDPHLTVLALTIFLTGAPPVQCRTSCSGR